MTGCDVPVGAISPYQEFTSKPGKVSATVGRSGSAEARRSVETAIARSPPACICASAPEKLRKAKCSRRPSRSVTTGAAPWYGTCRSWTWPISPSISPAKCVVLPGPTEP